MKKFIWIIAFSSIFLAAGVDAGEPLSASAAGDEVVEQDADTAVPSALEQDSGDDEDMDWLEDEEAFDEIADPFEPLNRASFLFNDKLYFWLVKPVAQGYAAVVPEGVRISIRNFFNNVSVPVRVVNNLLQFKMGSAGKELLRFGVNTTFGMVGFYDVARDELEISAQDEDFGQTLGTWGAGPGFYINWPVIGPSSLRDTAGYAGDYFLEPLNYVTPSLDRTVIKAGDTVNRASLTIGDYEEIKKDAIDPYKAVKDIYHQYRESRIER